MALYAIHKFKINRGLAVRSCLERPRHTRICIGESLKSSKSLEGKRLFQRSMVSFQRRIAADSFVLPEVVKGVLPKLHIQHYEVEG